MARGSHIIFVSTTLTTASTVLPGYLLYNSTKGAVEQMTRVISKDLGRKGVLVNAVAPGPVSIIVLLLRIPGFHLLEFSRMKHSMIHSR
jgi:NAD(P)-dependent dehydrogenase (short-subunit alcohol dehydrogenase family)